MRFLHVLVPLLLAGCLAPVEVLQQGMLPDSAPDFTVHTPAGEAWRLSDHVGDVVLLDLMAVDCPPCRRQAPLLQDVAGQHANDSFVMISIDLGSAFPGWGAEDEEALVRFQDEHGLTWPIASDTNGTVARDYRVLVLPTLVVVRADGTIHTTLLGERSLADIHQAVHDASLSR